MNFLRKLLVPVSLMFFTAQSALATGPDYSSLTTAFNPSTAQIIAIGAIVMGVIAVIFTLRKTLGVGKKSA